MGSTTTSRLFGTFGVTIAIQALGFLSGILLARLLGVEGRGELATVILWPTLIAYLGDMGGPAAYVYQSSSAPAQAAALIGNIIPLTISQALILYALGAPVVWLALSNMPEMRELAYVFLALYVPLNLVTRYFHSLNQGLGRFSYFNAVRVGVQAVYVFGTVLLWTLDMVSVKTVVVATIVSNVVAACIAYWGIKPAVNQLWKPDPILTRRTLSYGIRAHLGSMNPIESLRIDLAVVAAFLNPRDVGLYTVAMSFANIPRGIGGSVGMVALPTVAGAPDDDSRVDTAHRMLRLTVLVTGGLVAIFLLTAAWSVPLIYGDDFDSAVPVARMLGIGVVAATLRQVLGDCLRGAGFPLAGSIAELASWAALAIGLLVFFPAFGLIGVAVASVGSYVFSLVVSFWLGKAVLRLTPSSMVPTRSDLPRLRSMFEFLSSSMRGGKVP